jgi:hypothetical protein
MKKLLLVSILLAFTVTFYPQNKTKNNDEDMAIKGPVQLPEGWLMRFDKTNASKKDMKLVKEENYYHFTTGPAGIYYNPKDKESGTYQIEANFIQIKPSKHPEAYGIFFAGSNLEKDNQHYLYFLVRQDGKYLVKARNGEDTKEIVKWTANKSVNAQDKNGQTTNKLTVTVGKDSVSFSANGEKVVSLNKSDLGDTDGIAGLRINHNLNVKATDLNIVKL